MTQNDRLTHDYIDENRRMRSTEWGAGATVAYVVTALVVLGIIYFIAAAYWSSPQTVSGPAPAPMTDTTGQTAPLPLTTAPAEPAPAQQPAPVPETLPPAPEQVPAPSP